MGGGKYHLDYLLLSLNLVVNNRALAVAGIITQDEKDLSNFKC